MYGLPELIAGGDRARARGAPRVAVIIHGTTRFRACIESHDILHDSFADVYNDIYHNYHHVPARGGNYRHGKRYIGWEQRRGEGGGGCGRGAVGGG